MYKWTRRSLIGIAISIGSCLFRHRQNQNQNQNQREPVSQAHASKQPLALGSHAIGALLYRCSLCGTAHLLGFALKEVGDAAHTRGCKRKILRARRAHRLFGGPPDGAIRCRTQGQAARTAGSSRPATRARHRRSAHQFVLRRRPSWRRRRSATFASRCQKLPKPAVLTTSPLTLEPSAKRSTKSCVRCSYVSQRCSGA
jgi:hypothetical protein